jgi:DNA-binding transcriptional LysR family regulator
LPLIGDLAHQGWADWFRAAGVRGKRLRELHTFNDTTDAMQAAAYGIGAALGRTHIATPYLEDGTLIRLPGPSLKARFSYYIVHAANRRPSAEAEAFIAWLHTEAQRDRANALLAPQNPALTVAGLSPASKVDRAPKKKRVRRARA